MKTKILLAVILLLVLFSCKIDDESSGTTPISADEKYLSKVTNDKGVVLISLEYNTNKTIKKKVSGDSQVRYEYDQNGRVTKCYLSLPETPTIVTDFIHDANGNIIGYTQNNIEYKVEKIGNKYLFINNGDAYEVDVNNNNEILKYKTGDTQLDFFLVDEKLGPLSNTNNISIYDCISNPFSYFFFSALNNLNHEPIEEIIGALGPITFQNEYDQDGFLKKSVVNYNFSDGPQTNYLNYQYIKL